MNTGENIYVSNLTASYEVDDTVASYHAQTVDHVQTNSLKKFRIQLIQLITAII